MWLQKDWQKFAEHYSLGKGHFLVFRYKGNCKFHVLIVDTSASEINYPYANKNEEIQLQDVKIEVSDEEDDSVQIINDISTGKREKPGPDLQCPRPHKMMRPNPSYKTERSTKFGSVAAGFKHNNWFSAGKGKGIPKEFASKCMMDHGDVILYNGKTWKYRSIPSNRRPYVKLCNGWGKKVDFHGSPAFSDVSSRAKSEAGTSSSHPGCLEPLKAFETALQRAVKDRKRTLQRAQAFTSENPFFVVVIQASYIRKSALSFVFQMGNHGRQSTISEAVEDHMEESVMRAFVNDNNLKAGDVCALEMTNDTKISFKVSIFKAIADANCHPSQGVPQKPVCLTSQSPKAAIEKASVPPLFRIVVLPLQLKEHRVGIPRKFVKNYGNEMSITALLRVPTGAVWKVERTKFEVIFDRSASEIEYPYTSNNHRLSKEIPKQNIEESEDDDSIQTVEEISPSRKMREKSQLPCTRPHKIMRSTNSAIKTESNIKSEFLAPQFMHNGCPARKGLVKRNAGASSSRPGYQEPLDALEKAEAFQIARAFRSENPFFVVALQPSYVHTNKMYTREFCQEIFDKDAQKEVGDVCVFELIEGAETSLKVTIYKKQAVEDANSGSSLADKSRKNQVELQESLVIKTESDSVDDKGDMSSLQNQRPTEEFTVPKINENNSYASEEKS
ncbi:hypothetical protein REPUB_Repub09cG0173200 [Reevesia pubescens]